MSGADEILDNGIDEVAMRKMQLHPMLTWTMMVTVYRKMVTAMIRMKTSIQA